MKRLRRLTRTALAWTRSRLTPPELYDLLAATGLLLLAVGLWLIYPPAALIFVGAALIAFGFYGAKIWTDTSQKRRRR